jgi:hypothetical protein
VFVYACVQACLSSSNQGFTLWSRVLLERNKRSIETRQQTYFNACKYVAAAHAERFGVAAVPLPLVRARCASYFENPTFICKKGTKTRQQYSTNVYNYIMGCVGKIMKGDAHIWPNLQDSIIKGGLGSVVAFVDDGA